MITKKMGSIQQNTAKMIKRPVVLKETILIQFSLFSVEIFLSAYMSYSAKFILDERYSRLHRRCLRDRKLQLSF